MRVAGTADRSAVLTTVSWADGLRGVDPHVGPGMPARRSPSIPGGGGAPAGAVPPGTAQGIQVGQFGNVGQPCPGQLVTQLPGLPVVVLLGLQPPRLEVT